MAFQAGLMGQRRGQMGFAYPYAAEEDDVGVVLQKSQTHEILDLCSVYFFRPGPVVGVERLDDWEAGELDTSLDAVFASAVRLALQEVGEVVRIGPMVFDGGFGGLSIVLLDPGQLQFAQVGFDLVFHGFSLSW